MALLDVFPAGRTLDESKVIPRYYSTTFLSRLSFFGCYSDSCGRMPDTYQDDGQIGRHPACRPGTLASVALAIAHKTENLLGYSQAQRQTRNRITRPAPDTTDLDMNQTSTQLTTYGQTVLGLADIFQLMV
jgi:hypothetical protein